MELGQHEILFAQKLSCGEPGIRKKAFNRLEKWMKARSVKSKPFDRDDFLKLWKGLYYCLWQQDKPLNQEDLSDSITKLLDVLTDKQQKMLFIETFFEEMNKEWHSIDQWRMDKFMMLFRRFFRRILAWLKGTKWDSSVMTEVFDIFRATVWNPCPEAYPEGLKMHFVSFYLDELDNAAAGEFSSEKTFQFLEPYVELLKNKSLSDVCFDSVLNDIFKLLLEFTVDLLEKKEKNKTQEPSLEFDMKRIKTALFDAGKSKSTPRRRRGKIYSYVKKFDLIINGYDPFYESISPAEELLESDVESAAEKLIKVSSLTKKRKNADDGENDSDDDTDGESEKFIEARRRKKFTPRKKSRKNIPLDKLQKKKPSKKKPKK